MILLHTEGPAKPVSGAPCNGCGVCCAWQPCPLGMIVSGRRHGSCTALLWHAQTRQYRCGMLLEPARHLPHGLRWLAPLVARLARRWIAAGKGCDSDLQAGPAEAPGKP
ncbi:hypothetical protein [Aquabacterium sp.]|uniref:hypothetical protein n=1 Tax=Aquabacterium sp. TaxID=1872578 RepID=UPI00378440E4